FEQASLGNDDHVICPQFNISFDLFAIKERQVIERKHDVDAVYLSAHLYTVLCCKRCEAAGERNCLHYRCLRPEYEGAGSEDFTSDEDPRFFVLFETIGCQQAHGDIKTLRVFVFEPCCECPFQLNWCHATCMDRTGERKRNETGRADSDLLIELRIL